MNCIYCNSETSFYDTSAYDCHRCPIEVTYFTSMKSPQKIYYIYFTIDNLDGTDYGICLDKVQNECIIMKTSNLVPSSAATKILMTINYLPDITPHTVTQWLERMLNLMVFS